MKNVISYSLVFLFITISNMVKAQFHNNVPPLFSTVANNDVAIDMWRRGRTGIGFGGGAAYNAADPLLRSRLNVTNGIMSHYVAGIVGDLDNATWAGIGIGNPGGPVQPYGFSVVRSNSVGFYNLLPSLVTGAGEDLIAGFGKALTNANNRFRIRAYNNAATNPLNFKDILIANPNGAVGINAEPFSSLWVNSTLTTNPGPPNPIFKSIAITGNQVTSAFTTVSAIGNQQNSSLAADGVLVEGSRAQAPDFFDTSGKGVAVNLQVVRNDVTGVIPSSINIANDLYFGDYAELTWQSFEFTNPVTRLCAPVIDPNVEKNFYISFRNGQPGTPGNNAFSVNNKLPVATFTPRGRVGIATVVPACSFGPNPVFLDVNGGALFSGIFYPSDARYKKDVAPIANALEIVRKMQGTTYEMKHDAFPDKNFMQGKQYGYIAQELEKVVPELAVQGTDGYYGVNYTSLIPILSEAIKEQDVTVTTLLADNAQLKADNLKKDAEIARLNAEMQEIREDVANLKNLNVNQLGGTGYKLFQNKPNPFNTMTSIGFEIPSTATFKSASVNIYDLSGKWLQAYPVDASQSSLDIDATTLTSGTYIYDLLVDGEQVAIKRMVIIKNY